MSRFIKMILVSVSSLLVMIQFQNCSKIQMSSTDLTQGKLEQASTDGGGNDQLGAPIENESVPLVDCPELLVNGSVEYIPVQTIEEMVASQPAESRTDYLNELLNSCKAKSESASVSHAESASSSDPGVGKCVKVCHAEPAPAPAKEKSDDNSSDDDGSDDDDSSSDDASSDDNSSDDNSSDDNSSAD